jgi:hypothetical protein
MANPSSVGPIKGVNTLRRRNAAAAAIIAALYRMGHILRKRERDTETSPSVVGFSFSFLFNQGNKTEQKKQLCKSTVVGQAISTAKHEQGGGFWLRPRHPVGAHSHS